MTAHEPDDKIRAWLNEGPHRGTERGLEETLARLAATRQATRREVRLPLWLPAAAVLALLLTATAGFMAGFRIQPPVPAVSPSPAVSCRLSIPVGGRNAILTGSGFAPDTDVVLEIDRVSAEDLRLTVADDAALHTDRNGSFGIGVRPYPEDLGRDVIVATAGCTARIEAVTIPADLPPACPDPAQRNAVTLDGPRYRAAVGIDRPLAWWPLDDTDATARDSSGAHPAAYRGTFTHAALSALSDGGSVFLNWRPGQDATSVALGAPIALGGDFTIEAWTYLCHYDDDGDVIVGSPDSPTELFFENGFLSVSDGVTLSLRANTRVATLRWQDWVVTREAGQMRLYLDGRLDAEGDSWSGAMPVGLLGLNGAGDNLLGFLDEVAVYDHALTPERVAAHAAP